MIIKTLNRSEAQNAMKEWVFELSFIAGSRGRLFEDT